MKKKLRKILKTICIIFLLFITFRLFSPTWTPYINGENSISELKKVDINGANLEVMIRGSGKSYEFGEDYSMITATTHMDDLIALTEYIKEYLGKEQVILIGHSYGTYIATLSVAQRPDLYQAYVGIGQMSNTIESELSSLEKCITVAESEKDVEYLKSLETAISGGESITPRSYVRKYDGMTSPEIAEKYLCNMTGEGTKEFILFDESAHYPQFEEEEKFYQWMKDTFGN